MSSQFCISSCALDFPLTQLRFSHGHGQDPFMATPGSARRVHLSPTASAFTPARYSRENFAPVEQSPSFSMGREQDAVRSHMSYLTATSVPETPGIGSAYVRNSPPRFGPIARPQIVPPHPMTYCQIGHFDRENCNRAFAIEGAPTDMAYLSVANLFEVGSLPSFLQVKRVLIVSIISVTNSGLSRDRS